MTHDFTADVRTFWIAHGPALHYGELQPGESMSSGQNVFETFTSRRPWMARVIELGGSFE
jgi:hypothetical protein